MCAQGERKRMSIAVLFVLAKYRKQPKRPLGGRAEWGFVTQIPVGQQE